MKGLVHIYTGDGKGKTTAAIGLGIRAYGRGFRVLMVQFLKGAETGEITTLKLLGPNFVVNRGKEFKKFICDMNESEKAEMKKDTKEIFEYALASTRKGKFDMLIMDEVMAAITTGLIPLEDVVAFIQNKPEALEVVLTGRNAPKELIELADYVSEITAIKHPLDRGIRARKGIEC